MAKHTFWVPILVILAKMSAFDPFWEPDFYVSPLKGTIFMNIFGLIFDRTDGRTDARTDGRDYRLKKH